jgi:superfamily II DNA or RNA helicase
VVKKMKKRELIDDGHATDIIVQTFFIDYMSEDEKRDIYMAKKTFDDGEKALRYEQRMIRGSSKRLDWLAALAGKCVGNAIIFFLDIEGGYGHQIVERLKKTTSGKNIFYIDGSVPESHRQVFKQRMEESDNNLLVASYDTFSTGKSIKNLHYIICAEGRKSETAISQAMGRLMRLLSGKDHGTWIDIVDDLSITIREGGEDVRHDNYMIKWFKERKKYYESEDFKHNIHHINIKDYLFG